jgi:rod shape determining protein RodA
VTRLGGAFSRQRPRLGGGRLRRVIAVFDWPLFGSLALLCTIGLANLYSATYQTAHSGKFDQQVVWFAIGLAAYVALAVADYHVWHRMVWAGLGAVIALIVYVLLFTDPIKGSQRWISLGALVRIQPSEIAKVAVILALARLLHDHAAGELSRRRRIIGVVALAVPVALVAVQPDLGTAVLLALILIAPALLLVKNLVPLLGMIAAGAAAMPLVWSWMGDYQQLRIKCFLDPSIDPTGHCYHILQSLNAVGSGRMSGKGFFNATQNRLNFLPEHWTDFPFSVWAEEWGFLGSVALVGLYVFLILWIVGVAARAKDMFGTAICLGVAAMLFWHAVVNIAMVLSLAPVVGVTLPFVSYGGSSAASCFIGLGLVASVSARSRS